MGHGDGHQFPLEHGQNQIEISEYYDKETQGPPLCILYLHFVDAIFVEPV